MSKLLAAINYLYHVTGADMADLYIGDYGKKGEWFAPNTNFEDHKAMVNFDGCRFLEVDDGLLIGLHATSIDGLGKKSTITFPNLVLFHLHTKPYEYEAYTDGAKKKATIEPTNREKLLYKILTDKENGFDHETNSGKGGFISFGASGNDAPILAGEGNYKKHARFVLEFDDDIKRFDLSDDKYKLDGLAGKGSGKSGYSSKPAETEAQKIEARKTAIALLMTDLGLDYKQASDNQVFLVHSCLLLGLPIPANIQITF